MKQKHAELRAHSLLDTLARKVHNAFLFSFLIAVFGLCAAGFVWSKLEREKTYRQERLESLSYAEERIRREKTETLRAVLSYPRVYGKLTARTRSLATFLEQHPHKRKAYEAIRTEIRIRTNTRK